jgi:hypothetical protein
VRVGVCVGFFGGGVQVCCGREDVGVYLIADLSGEVEEIHRWCLVRVQPWAEAGDGRNSECGGREEEIQ